LTALFEFDFYKVIIMKTQKTKVDKDASAMNESYNRSREIAQRVQSIVDRNVMLHNGNRLVNI